MKRKLAVSLMLWCWLVGSAGAATVPALLDWDRETVLSLPVKGVVTRLEVRPGDTVKKGRLLLELDQRPFRNRVEALVAKLRKLEAVLQEAKRELERAEELYDRTVLSEHELQVTKNAHIAAQADYEAGRAELTAARLALEYSRLRAPFALRVLECRVAVGQTVAADLQPTPVLRVAAEDTLRAVAMLDAATASTLQPGQALAVRVGPVRRQGRLVAIEPVTVDEGIAYRIAVRVARSGQAWLAGQAAEITLP